MNKKKLYMIFDFFPPDNYGGLIITYHRLFFLLREEYDFEIVSIFDCGRKNSALFPGVQISSVSNFYCAPSVGKVKKQLKNKKPLKAIAELLYFIVYFFYIPVGRVKLRRKLDPDSIKIATSPATAMFCSSKIKYILEIHSSYDYFFGTKRNILSYLQTLFMSKPQLVIFRTKSDAIKAKNLFNSYYMYNFFDEQSSVDNNIDLKKRGKSIIFVGRLAPEKNLMRMLSIAKQLKEYENEFILDIYGTGIMKDPMLRYIEENDLSENVTLKGFNSDKSIYGNYSMQWITSTNEGFALVIIEAKAFGVPTLSSVWGDGVFEIIHDGTDGYILDTDEDFIRHTLDLWKNHDKLREVSLNARDGFHMFGREQAYTNWKNILLKAEKEDYSFNLEEGQ